MDDDTLARWKTLKITDDEEKIVGFDDLPKGDVDNSIDLALVGRVMTMRPYNFDAFKKTMNQIWAITKDALFRSIENGLFVVQFATARDRAKVLDGRPWTFDQYLVLMTEIERGLQPSDIALTHTPIWVRMYNLPLDSRSDKHIRILGSSMGDVLEVDNDGILWDQFGRVKISLNILKPLRRVQRVRNSSGKVVVIEIKYERLPTYCYVCGLIGHMERDCVEAVEEGRGDVKQWGAWLKASPRRGGVKKQDEARRFLSCSKVLNFGCPVPRRDVDGDAMGVEPNKLGISVSEKTAVDLGGGSNLLQRCRRM